MTESMELYVVCRIWIELKGLFAYALSLVLKPVRILFGKNKNMHMIKILLSGLTM